MKQMIEENDMGIPKRRCKYLIINECSLLNVKCFEKRFFGGVEICQVREVKRLPPPPPEKVLAGNVISFSGNIFTILAISKTKDESLKLFCDRMIEEFKDGDYLPCIFIDKTGLGLSVSEYIQSKGLAVAGMTLNQLKQISD